MDCTRSHFEVQLVGPGEIRGAYKYESPDGRLPDIDDVICLRELASRARVVDVSSETNPQQIRAELL
ncbi:MAG TPA: hypothetical protein VFA66_10590 [Gaiellaceae bacterium]|nr:hypothetical protein [Gaiellaceae bacterium]